MTCKHEKWLYIPTSVGIGDGKLIFDDNSFLCANCGSWIGMGSLYPVEKIVNVKHLSKENCSHDISFYTLQSTRICLRCGYTWMPNPPKLDIKVDINWKQLDKERRQKILEEYSDGRTY